MNDKGCSTSSEAIRYPAIMHTPYKKQHTIKTLFCTAVQYEYPNTNERTSVSTQGTNNQQIMLAK